jgi:hypothetical protein
MSRITKGASSNQSLQAMMVLGWLVCAKRPLKWYEIQGMKAIDLDDRSIQYERRRFLVEPQDLCESLIVHREDDTVELVHMTAKL